MKRYDYLMAGLSLLFACVAVGVFFLFIQKGRIEGREYMVEINQIMKGLEKEGSFSKPDLFSMDHVFEVDYMDVEDLGKAEEYSRFFSNKNGAYRHIAPLILDGRIKGFVRFDHRFKEVENEKLWLSEGVIFMSWALAMGVMLTVKRRILVPFHRFSNMPYELAKGHLKGELTENKSRYFGKFIWGITMLRDHLRSTRDRELKLEREKKMLLLSISHDIKTPVSTIKLYAKALEEGVYGDEEGKRQAAVQVQALAGEIEGFVREIVRNASQDILPVEVEPGEFYLKELVEQVKEYFVPKCSLMKVDFTIGKYENRLLKGNLDAAFEAVENLMENAFKYGDGRRIEIGFGEEEYCQLIWIWNSGKSVPEGEMVHLFDSFYRGSNAGDKAGNGLGLYICRELMRKMDGEIFGETGDGMKFVLVFR